MWGAILSFIYYIVVALIVSYLTRPKPQNAAPQNPDGAPTIADDAIVPVLFGTRVLSNNNIIWWGHTRTQGITKGGKK